MTINSRQPLVHATKVMPYFIEKCRQPCHRLCFL